jgi:hypothetical protein
VFPNVKVVYREGYLAVLEMARDDDVFPRRACQREGEEVRTIVQPVGNEFEGIEG